MAYLDSQNQIQVFAGLQALLGLSSRYEYEIDENRRPLDEAVRETFPKIGLLINDMINNQDNSDALELLHLICEIFYTCNQMRMNEYLME